MIVEGRNIPKDANCFDIIIDTCTHSMHAPKCGMGMGYFYVFRH